MDHAKILNQDILMAYAKVPSDTMAKVLAAGIAPLYTAYSGREPVSFPSMGLDQNQFATLLDHYFPGAREKLFEIVAGNQSSSGDAPLRGDEFDDLLQLLLEHRSNINNETEWLARAIATACLGNNHLWQDLGLPNRQALSDILEKYFTTLFEKNIGHMKWKKFFYKQLCERINVHVCKAPSCAVCCDYAKCFGPEDAVEDVGL